MENDKNKNSALYCYVCQGITEELKKEGIVSLRTEDPISGRTITICNECLKSLNRKLYTEQKPVNFHKRIKRMQDDHILVPVKVTPKYIYNLISDHVIGQERAKRAISLAVATHLRRLEDSTLEKSNVLLMGPTGSGKTELARSVSKLLNLPLVITDATTLTAHGYVGEDVENILFQLLNAADGDIALAEKGIIFIDEFDKLAQTSSEVNINTTAVQQSLLKMIEGGKVKIPKSGSKRTGVEFVTLDTSKILFICAGAFPGLEEIVKKNQKTSIGIGSTKVAEDTQSPLELIENKHLTSYGLIPEIIGRLPVITFTESLSTKALISILTEPKNSLTGQYRRLLANYGVDLTFTPDFLESVAHEALASGLGARGLRSVMEKRLANALFEGPDLEGDKKIVASASGVVFNPSIKVQETEYITQPLASENISLESLVEARRASRKKKKPTSPNKEANE